MRTIWLVVWLWSSCGKPQQCILSGYEGGCNCELRHATYDDAMEGGIQYIEYSPYSYIVKISTPDLKPDNEPIR